MTISSKSIHNPAQGAYLPTSIGPGTLPELPQPTRGGPVSILAIRDFQCRWIVDGTDPAFGLAMMCGKPCHGLNSLCDEHRLRARGRQQD